MKKYFCLSTGTLIPALFLLLTSFCLMSCASTGSKKNNVKSDIVDVDDSLLGTWVQTAVGCTSGEMTTEGKEASVAFKSGMSVAKAVVTSDKVFWDMKEYRDVENPNDFCQISVEEKWSTQAPNVLVVSGSDTVVAGNGQVSCDKQYKYTSVRKHTYKASEKDLSIVLSSGHDAQTGVSSSDKPLCKDGQVVLSFQRDGGDE